MHRQTEEREERLLAALPGGASRSAVVAVVAGEGNRRLFEDLGAERIVEGGQTMNPSTADLLEAIDATAADEVVLLPNNSNVVMAAEQAARVAGKPVQVVPTDVDPRRPRGARRLPRRALGRGERGGDARGAGRASSPARSRSPRATPRPTASPVREGEFLALLDGKAVAAGAGFDEVARALLERLLAEPRDVLTLLRGEGAPSLNGLLDELAEQHPELELDVHEGGQPHYPLLLSAE